MLHSAGLQMRRSATRSLARSHHEREWVNWHPLSQILSYPVPRQKFRHVLEFFARVSKRHGENTSCVARISVLDLRKCIEAWRTDIRRDRLPYRISSLAFWRQKFRVLSRVGVATGDSRCVHTFQRYVGPYCVDSIQPQFLLGSCGRQWGI